MCTCVCVRRACSHRPPVLPPTPFVSSEESTQRTTIQCFGRNNVQKEIAHLQRLCLHIHLFHPTALCTGPLPSLRQKATTTTRRQETRALGGLPQRYWKKRIEKEDEEGLRACKRGGTHLLVVPSLSLSFFFSLSLSPFSSPPHSWLLVERAQGQKLFGRCNDQTSTMVVVGTARVLFAASVPPSPSPHLLPSLARVCFQASAHDTHAQGCARVYKGVQEDVCLQAGKKPRGERRGEGGSVGIF